VVHSIAHLHVDSTLSLRLLEFFSPSVEASWWRTQEQLYDLLQARHSAVVTFTDQDGSLRSEEVGVSPLPAGGRAGDGGES